VIEHVHRAHAGVALGGRGVDAADARVRVRRAHDAGEEHPRQADVGGVPRGAGDLGPAVETRRGLADDLELRVDRQRRRLVGRDGALHVAHVGAGDAGGEADGLLLGHVSPPSGAGGWW
jgi:hypothetical protein